MKNNDKTFIEEEYTEIDILDISVVEESIEMYDIEVEEDHTFAITDLELVSHNCLKSMLRSLTYKAAKADVPIIFSNHIYGNPAELHPSLVKNQSGGSGPLYLASLLVQLATKSERAGQVGSNVNKESTETINPIAKGVNGMTLRALTVKNRFAPPFLEAEMYLNFQEGLSRYTGLLPLAVGYGAIIQTGTTYQLLDGKKLGFYKQWRDDATLWEEVICKELEKQLQAKLKFNNATEPEEIETEEEETTDEP